MTNRRPALLSLALILVLAPRVEAVQGRTQTAAERAAQERALQEELRTPRPIDAVNSVWIDELTWMEVRDAIAAGKRTAVIATGGIEQNGPYLVTGKHNVVLRGACEAIARKLGDALCAPVVRFVPEGAIEPKSGHMRYPGTISLREETYTMLLDDIASSLKAHGFTSIVFIGDSGGNQRGMEAVAAGLNERWADASAYFVPEFYEYAEVERYMEEDLGFAQPVDEGLHDNLYITSLMMVVDPTSVRYDERVRAGKATINGASIAPSERTIELGRKLLEFRAELTVRAIRAAMASASR
jgi:creatinine amidohydrolase